MANSLMIKTHETSRIAGVRPLHASDLLYVDVPAVVSPVSTGDWLVVRHQDADVLGCVVIAPDQLVCTDVPDDLPVFVRRATERDLARDGGDADSGPQILGDDRPQFGGTGPLVPNDSRSASHSREDDRYRAIKAGLPRLGDVIAIPHGRGMVVGVSTSKLTISVKVGDEPETRCFDAKDLVPQESSAH